MLGLRPQNLGAQTSRGKQGKIAVRPRMVGYFKLRLGHDLQHPAGMGAHPLAAHKERGRDMLGPQKTENIHIAAGSNGIQLAKIKGKSNHLGPIGQRNPPDGAHRVRSERWKHH